MSIIDAMLPFNYVRAYKPKDAFGQPRAALRALPANAKTGIPDDDVYVKMGTIIGYAESQVVSEKDTNQGGTEFFYGLKGTFEAMPADPTKIAPSRANIAWLPDEWQSVIEKQLTKYIHHETGEVIKNENGAVRVDFALEVGILTKASSSTGFVWTHKPLFEVTAASDPLASIREQLARAGAAYPQLGAPKGVGTTDIGDAEADGAPETHDDAGETVEGEIDAASGNAAIAQATEAPHKGKARK